MQFWYTLNYWNIDRRDFRIFNFEIKSYHSNAILNLLCASSAVSSYRGSHAKVPGRHLKVRFDFCIHREEFKFKFSFERLGIYQGL